MASGEFSSTPQTGDDKVGDVHIGGQAVDVDSLITQSFINRNPIVEVAIPCDDGKVVLRKFKTYPRRSEYEALLEHAGKLYRGLPAYGSVEQKAHPWADKWPQGPQEFVEAFLVSSLAIEPNMPIETALIWLAHPTLIPEIVARIEGESKTLDRMWLANAIMAKKKNLTETESANSASGSVGESESIPTT